MSFFDDIDKIRILERDAKKIEGLELREARKLLHIYKQAGNAITARLLQSPDNSYTEAKLQRGLSQITVIADQLQARINALLDGSFSDIYDEGLEDSVRETNEFEKHFNRSIGIVSLDVVLRQSDKSNFLLNQFKSSLLTYKQSMRDKIQHSMGQSLVQGLTWSQTVAEVGNVIRLDEWKIARIVRTETHNIYNVSKLNGFSQIKETYLPDLKKTLYHPIDARTGEDSKIAEKKDLIVAINKPFKYNYRGKVREFMTPPDRPNDRAILIPYRNEYDKRR